MLFFFQNYKRVIRQASQGLELHAKECSVDIYNDKNRLVGNPYHKPIEEFTIAFLSLNRVVIFLSPRDFCSPCLSIPLLPSQFKHPIKTPKRTNLRQYLTNHSVQQFFKIWVPFKTILVFDIYIYILIWTTFGCTFAYRSTFRSMNELIDLKLLKQTINSAVWFVWRVGKCNKFLKRIKKEWRAWFWINGALTRL